MFVEVHLLMPRAPISASRELCDSDPSVRAVNFIDFSIFFSAASGTVYDPKILPGAHWVTRMEDGPGRFGTIKTVYPSPP